MKRTLIFLVFLFPLSAAAFFDRDLYFGMRRDPDVQALQEFLSDQNLYSGPITGNFLSLTLRAVKSFQVANSISPVSGYFGPLTRGKANAILTSQGITSGGVTNESGVLSNPSATVPKMKDEAAAKISNQIKALMDQLATLKKNRDALAVQSKTLQVIQNQPQSTQPVTSLQNNTTNPVSSPTTETQTLTTIQISAVNIIPSLTSAQIEWQTNISTNSKIFLSGDGSSSKVFSSESGLSTRHIANITGLVSNTSYSYEIESISGKQVIKKDGSFSTKKGELTIQANTTSIQLADWNSIRATAQYTENGKAVPVDISFSAPGESKTFKIIQNWPACGSVPFLIQLVGTIGGSCSSDGKVDFDYKPKSLGIHTISVSAGGVTKSVDIQVVSYVKVDPTIRKIVNVTPEQSSSGNTLIGKFWLTDADEQIDIGKLSPNVLPNDPFIRLSTNFVLNPTDGNAIGIGTWNAWRLRFQVDQDNQSYYVVSLNENLVAYLNTNPSIKQNYIGMYTFTIEEIRGRGQKSGLFRTVGGLPITFTFEIR